jgi:hypothetical protein
MTETKGGQLRSGDVRGVHYYDPSSIEDVIESYLRRQHHARERFGDAAKKHPAFKRGPLGLNEAELNAMRLETVNRFLDGAKLSEELLEQQKRFRETFTDRLDRFRKNPDKEMNDLAESQAVLFARACETAVGKASGDFADLLTQAVIARRGRKDFSLSLRREMWAEGLRFAVGLARFETAGAWIDKAWGIDPRESPLPHLYRLESISEQQAEVAKFMVRFRATFEERIRHGSPGWLNEADRKIELRCLLSSALQRRANPNDPSKKAVSLLLTASPELTTEQVCAKLDAQNERTPGSAPIPKAWRKWGVRSWIEAHEKLLGRVKTYVSTVRKQAGITQSPSERS